MTAVARSENPRACCKTETTVTETTFDLGTDLVADATAEEIAPVDCDSVFIEDESRVVATSNVLTKNLCVVATGVVLVSAEINLTLCSANEVTGLVIVKAILAEPLRIVLMTELDPSESKFVVLVTTAAGIAVPDASLPVCLNEDVAVAASARAERKITLICAELTTGLVATANARDSTQIKEAVATETPLRAFPVRLAKLAIGLVLARTDNARAAPVTRDAIGVVVAAQTLTNACATVAMGLVVVGNGLLDCRTNADAGLELPPANLPA